MEPIERGPRREMLKKERELVERILVPKIGSLGRQRRTPRRRSEMSDKPTVTVGVQTGDVPSGRAADPHIVAMRNLLQTHCRGPYSPDVDEFSLIFRIDGDIWHWEKGLRPHAPPQEERYITIDIYVPGRDGKVSAASRFASTWQRASRMPFGK